ncbi:hypothetical protein [Coxiella endosymbiont of Ornithodoros maritimus]|uniref:hypothetical protein n=1 Tax=Coxiella endosymbiont of Ornithodoros maritimus TaxID=1656172 RepID=UPI002264FD55|nr:hypothetical protein [Coxiella endosymbiont of Ornithodoros maritimus]
MKKLLMILSLSLNQILNQDLTPFLNQAISLNKETLVEIDNALNDNNGLKLIFMEINIYGDAVSADAPYNIAYT